MKTGFIGLGAVGGKLAGNLINNGVVDQINTTDRYTLATFIVLPNN